jgi:hypothetical protein
VRSKWLIKRPREQVSRIKERVEEKEGIPPVQQRLIFGGKQMYVLGLLEMPSYFFLWVTDLEISIGRMTRLLLNTASREARRYTWFSPCVEVFCNSSGLVSSFEQESLEKKYPFPACTVDMSSISAGTMLSLQYDS